MREKTPESDCKQQGGPRIPESASQVPASGAVLFSGNVHPGMYTYGGRFPLDASKFFG
jgi:hypothetical protein